MDDLQNFVAAMNLSKFRDQIRTEVDPARRKTLLTLMPSIADYPRCGSAGGRGPRAVMDNVSTLAEACMGSVVICRSGYPGTYSVSQLYSQARAIARAIAAYDQERPHA